jgi:hypothetical protein
LADGRQHHRFRKDFRNLALQPKPLQSRLREHERIVLPFVELADARLDIAANLTDSQVGPRVQQLALPAQAARADGRPAR